MARFVFDLEPLLTARRHAEREKMLIVAEAERSRRDLEDRLRRRQQFIVDSRNAQRDRLVGTLEVSALREHAGKSIEAMRDAQRVAVELAGAYRRLEQAQADLGAAAAARRAIELLKERRFEAWKRRLDKRETAELDEIAGRRAGTGSM